MTNNNLTINIASWGETFDCRLEVGTYTNGRLALALAYWDEEMQGWFPHVKVTVNMPEVHLNEGEFLVKDWSENEPIATALLEAGWLIRTGREVHSGFVFPMVAKAAGALKEFLDNSPRS
jgi:hypothetical protein